MKPLITLARRVLGPRPPSNMVLQRVDPKFDLAVQVVDNSGVVAQWDVRCLDTSMRDPFADGLRLINIKEEIGGNTVGIEAEILRSLPFAALVEKADSGEDYGEIGQGSRGSKILDVPVSRVGLLAQMFEDRYHSVLGEPST